MRDHPAPKACHSPLSEERTARDALLSGFVDDTRRKLERSTSALGRMTARHIGRQLDLLDSDIFGKWFQTSGAPAGFDHAVTRAAVAGSDVTRPSGACSIVRQQFGLTEDRVRALAAGNGLAYGRVFDQFGPLEDLYMHAEAGRHYTLAELLRRGQSGALWWRRAARAASDAIVGHDSFNAGFGEQRLKPMLAARHGAAAAEFDYPASRSLDGFLVQVLDRLDGFEAETMIRYVTEGVSNRGEPLPVAIRVGIVENAEYLRAAYDRLLDDARRRMSASAFEAFLGFPGMQEFSARLGRVSRLVGLLGRPADGRAYLLTVGPRSVVALDSLHAVRAHLPRALLSAAA